jgi:hypothetical protein
MFFHVTFYLQDEELTIDRSKPFQSIIGNYKWKDDAYLNDTEGVKARLDANRFELFVSNHCRGMEIDVVKDFAFKFARAHFTKGVRAKISFFFDLD